MHIYCLITCNIKSLLNVPKISYISRKISQVSRFPAKSPDSRNKFVFLPKQPLSELSPPVIKLFGEEHESTADSYFSLGVTQHEMKDYKAALQSDQRALAIRIKLK